MNQISKLLMLGALATTMWSCSGDDAPANNGGQNNPVFQGDGYLAVQINLPQIPSTRADNDAFDDGTDNEYKVENAALILFKGDTEEKAEVIGGYALGADWGTNTPATDNITSTYKKAVQVTGLNLSASDKLFGLVFVNYDQNLIKFSPTELTIGASKVTTFTNLQSSKIGSTDFNQIVTGSGASASKFFMTNAVLSRTPGETNNPSATPGIFTLVDLSSVLYETADDAEANPAGCIYVERAVAKITAKQSAAAKTFTIGTGDKAVTYEVEMSYVLDNTETESFIVRNVQAASSENPFFRWDYNTGVAKPYRMIGALPMPAITGGHTAPQYYYRTYWCKDPHYNTALTSTSPEQTAYANLEFISFNDANENLNPLYCFENTFDVPNMTYGNTTRVLIKVTMKKQGEAATDLYVLNGHKDEFFTSADDVKSFGKDEILKYDGIKQALMSIKKEGVTGDVQNAEKYIKITYTDELDGKADQAGDIKIESISLNTDEEGFDSYFDSTKGNPFASGTYASMVDELIKLVNSKNVISKYVGGTSYFQVLPEHFGDTYTPLPDNWTGSDVTAVYGNGATITPEKSNDYLGRYGLVRNNWYDITVSNIIGLGEPVVPTLDLTLSDDNKKEKKYIAIEVHTLSWAKRTQNTVLGQ